MELSHVAVGAVMQVVQMVQMVQPVQIRCLKRGKVKYDAVSLGGAARICSAEGTKGLLLTQVKGD